MFTLDSYIGFLACQLGVYGTLERCQGLLYPYIHTWDLFVPFKKILLSKLCMTLQLMDSGCLLNRIIIRHSPSLEQNPKIYPDNIHMYSKLITKLIMQSYFYHQCSDNRKITSHKFRKVTQTYLHTYVWE